MQHVPGKTDTRLEVLVVLRVGLAYADKRKVGRIESYEAVFRVGGRHVPGITHTKFQRQVRLDLEAVLGKEVEGRLVDAVGDVANGPGGDIGRVRDEVSGCLIGELSRIAVEVIVEEIAPFRAELEGMTAMYPAQRIAEHQHGIAASLREGALVAKGQAAQRIDQDGGHRLLIRSQSGAQSQRIGISGVVGSERDMDAVGADAGLVHQRGAEHRSFVQGEHLAVALARVAKAGDAGARAGLDAQIVLEHVVAVQAVLLAENVMNVRRALVDIHGRSARTQEGRLSVEGSVGCRYETQQGPGRRPAGRQNRVAGGGIEYLVGQGQSLALAYSFITHKKEGLVFENRPAQVAAELVALERRNPVGSRYNITHNGDRVKGVAGVEKVVTNKIIELAVILIGARPGCDIDDGSGVASEFRAVGGIIDLELRHRVDGRLEGDLVLHHIVQVDSVDHEIDRVFAIAGGVEGKRALSAQRSGQKAVLRRRYGSRNQQRQIDKMAAVQRDFLNCFLVDALGHGHGGCLHQRGAR